MCIFCFKGKEAEARVTVFRKTEESYSLKLKASREFFSKVCVHFFYLVLYKLSSIKYSGGVMVSVLT